MICPETNNECKTGFCIEGVCNIQEVKKHDEDKVITYKLSKDTGSGFLVDTSLEGIIETMKVEFQEDDELEESLSYTITREKKYTQQELDDMSEWDGF